jgi:hypothetical protein
VKFLFGPGFAGLGFYQGKHFGFLASLRIERAPRAGVEKGLFFCIWMIGTKNKST